MLKKLPIYLEAFLLVTQILFLAALYEISTYPQHLIDLNLPGRPLPALTELFFHSGILVYAIIACLLFALFIVSRATVISQAFLAFTVTSVGTLLLSLSLYLIGLAFLLEYQGPLLK